MSYWLRIAALSAALAMVVGCGKQPADEKPVKDKGKGKEKEGDKTDGGTKHDGWWCDEHGVPEGECGMCNEKIAARVKKEDQCPKHADRTKDQCFICNPDKWAASAARYKAHYPGKEPPQPNDENWPKK